MFTEDLTIFLNDFGVTATAGAVNGVGILDMPEEYAANGMVITTDYTLTCRVVDFGGLLYGDAITVDGINYQVREVRKVDDGGFCQVAMTKLAPGATAPGGQPREFGLQDLADVTLASPAVGEVLKYDGSQWVDGVITGAAYVFTQPTAATTWTINHNLGYIPSIELFDSGSQEIDAEVSHPSVNTALIVFAVPVAGFARLT